MHQIHVKYEVKTCGVEWLGLVNQLGLTNSAISRQDELKFGIVSLRDAPGALWLESLKKWPKPQKSKVLYMMSHLDF